MNNFSKKEWIDLVFEDRNKSYGAYELRAKSGNMMLKALFIGIMLALSLISIPVITNYMNPVSSTAEIIFEKKEDPFDKDVVIIHVDTDKFKKDKEESKIDVVKPAKQKVEKSAEDIIKYVEPVITDKETVTEEIKSVDELAGKKSGAEDVEGSPDGKIDATNPGKENISGDIDGTEKGEEDGDTVFKEYMLDKKASFPGGVESFIKIIQRSYRVPDINQSQKYIVHVSFIVEIDGSITDIKVLKDPGYGLGKEAVRTLKNIKTKWEPGIFNGKPVRTLYQIPISVSIK